MTAREASNVAGLIGLIAGSALFFWMVGWCVVAAVTRV